MVPSIEIMACVSGIAIVFAILGTLYSYVEHNKKNALNFEDNPLRAKWIIGGLLGGLAAAGIVISYLNFAPDMAIEEVLAKFGAITGATGIIVAKVFNEGISACAKWSVQKAKEIKEVAQDPEIVEMKAAMAEILKRLGGEQ